ncbi:hypothetical protein R3P38DRAFT_2840949 [Favolaschia claudopus]|uniref:Uncharacterized protein n=1 Tax=Favolaschia claudopus TaxID=2862362 RepID=A0AAW0E1E0_9AGAR
MSLDQNLFTLLLTPSPEHGQVDLVDPEGRIHYRKRRAVGAPLYQTEIYDPLSESLLATATAPSASSKIKFLQLQNPAKTVELKYTGTLSFRWSFQWEEHDFEWKREECYLLRKPDPPVLVAVTKEPPGRLKTTSVQILDYNLRRFDVEDRKGLEIVILTALMTFQDANEASHLPDISPPKRGSSKDNNPVSPTAGPAPSPPPKPPKKTGIDRIAELQAVRGQFNEVTVEDEGSIQDYAQYCTNLFQDDMLFVTISSAGSEHVPKVLQVVEETKRMRHKAGIQEDLHQYVLYDTQPKKPRRINLNDLNEHSYAPPESLVVHLSKIPMPELQPQAKTPGPPPPIPDTRPIPETKESKKEQKKREEAKRKEQKKATVSTPLTPDRLTRPSRSSPPHNSQFQPTPSPSQLNNPGIYVAPPPRPHSAYEPTPSSTNLVSSLRGMLHRPRSGS